MNRKLKPSYYRNPGAEFLAKDLLGKVLYTNKEGNITAGIITETEVYFGIDDKGSHVYGNRRTGRTEIIYGEGGFTYVYLCYGIHHLLNIVVSEIDDPKCVLIRSIEPFAGPEIIEQRRKIPVRNSAVSSGPGSLTKALGIDGAFNKKDVTGDEIWIEDIGNRYAPEEIAAVPRIGIAYAEEHALLPLRFYIKSNPYVSKKVKSV